MSPGAPVTGLVMAVGPYGAGFARVVLGAITSGITLNWKKISTTVFFDLRFNNFSVMSGPSMRFPGI